MIIPEATTSDIQLKSPFDRAGYSVRELSQTVRRAESKELLLDQKVIEARGLRCEPFWDTPGDPEGECYRDYIAKHPEFSLQLRQTVVDMLVEAQKQLPAEWNIVLKAGFRPYDVQVGLLHSLKSEAREEHPEWSEERVLEHARTFVSDPTIVCPPHVTGGAVDIDIVDADGQRVDMGCPPNTDDEISFIFSDKLDVRAKENRKVLLDAMLSVGFAPLASEWWHFQYGETLWAAFYGRSSTKYDLITVQ